MNLACEIFAEGNLFFLNQVLLFVCCFLHLGGLKGRRVNIVNRKESPSVSLYQRPLTVPATLRYPGSWYRGPNKNEI